MKISDLKSEKLKELVNVLFDQQASRDPAGVPNRKIINPSALPIEGLVDAQVKQKKVEPLIAENFGQPTDTHMGEKFTKTFDAGNQSKLDIASLMDKVGNTDTNTINEQIQNNPLDSGDPKALADVLNASFNEQDKNNSALSNAMLTDFIIRGNLGASGTPVSPTLTKEVLANQGADIGATKLAQDQSFGEQGIDLTNKKIDLNKFLGEGNLALGEKRNNLDLKKLLSLNSDRKSKIDLASKTLYANLLRQVSDISSRLNQSGNKGESSLLKSLISASKIRFEEASTPEEVMNIVSGLKEAVIKLSGR